jgi:ABC-type glycerol-3-phosphate transport system substrate-binding protein
MNMPTLPNRPFQIVVFGVFVALAIAGLLLFSIYQGGNSAAKVGTVTIWGVLPSATVGTQLDALKAAHKEYANVNYVEKSAASFDAVLADALASGTGPDLILISQEQLLTEKNKISVIPFSVISERTYLNTFVPIDELFLTDQGMYGIPFTVDPLVMYYNRTMLPTPPATWEAVTGLAPRLTQKSGGQVYKSAIALGGYGNIDNARAIISTLLFQSGSPITTLSNGAVRAAITQSSNAASAGVNPAESAINFYTQFADPAKTVYSWNGSLANARQAFTAGDLALYIGYASEEPFLAAANPNLDFDMTTVPQPATSQTRTTYGLAYAFAVPKATHNYSGAVSVARTLAGKDQAAQAARTLFMAPAARALLTPAANEKYPAVFYPEALTAKGWLSPQPATTDSIFAAMIGNISSGRNTVQDALQTANQALDSAF